MNKFNDIKISSFASSATDKRYLLSYNGSYYEANQLVVGLIEELQNSSNIDDAVKSYGIKMNGKYSSEQINAVVDKLIKPILEAKPVKRSFIYQKEIFSVETIDRFSNSFRFLFTPWVMGCGIALAFLLDLYFLIFTDNLLVFNNAVNAYLIIGLFVFMLGSSLFHELGHAAACKYFGVRHGGIGFGLYLNFPVLYTDVTSVWNLDWKKRCIVNIAGVYFQCYILIVLLLLFFVSGNDMLRYLILTMNLGLLMTLNPFFKFDGYWIVSDWLGIPNLRARSLELLKYWVQRICKKSGNKIPYLLKISSKAKYGLLLYSIVVNLFMGFYFLYIIPQFLYRFFSSFPREFNELILYLSNRMTPSFTLLRNISGQILFLVFLCYFLYNLIRPFLKRYVKR